MGVKMLVFVVTHFGKLVTRVGVSVPVDCTAEQFKKEFESIHFKIHPEHGKLRVKTLEVKLESFFYPLLDSLPVRRVLDGEEQCLHVRASESAMGVNVVTNFGTRIVVPIPVDCTAGNFKKEFETVHFKIHPEHGKLRVETLEVKLESFFYPLLDSLPVRLVLDGEEQCLHVRAEKRKRKRQEEKGIRTSVDDSDHQRQGIIDASLELQGADIEEQVNSDPKSPLVNSNYIVPDTPAYRLHDEPTGRRLINGGTMDSSRRLMFD